MIENFGEKRMDIISKWEEKSRDFIDTFLLLFGREGRIVSFIIILMTVLLIALCVFIILKSKF